MEIIEKTFVEAGRFVREWGNSQDDENIKAPENINFISQNKNGSYLVVINETGQCYVETAVTREIAIKWLNYEIDLEELYRMNNAY